MTTIRELIDALAEVAEDLPAGDSTPVEFAICDGSNLQMVGDMDVDRYTRVRDDGGPDHVFLMFRAHVHPGEKSGELLRDAVVDVDQELRDLLDEGDA